MSLAAYNAGENYADTLWKRHSRQDIDVFAEEISIRETRGYVKRVLRTFGIYRWLYDGQAPTFVSKLSLPAAHKQR